jgi:hypothetical protein
MAGQNPTEDPNAKAHALLKSILTEEQFFSLQTNNYFVVTGQSGVEYRINLGYSQNIYSRRPRRRAEPAECGCDKCKERYAIKTEGWNKQYCYHMQIGAPLYDHMIAQVLYIRHAEQMFLDGAYISG